MVKIVIIGAGSGFGIKLSYDVLATPVLDGATIALCDIDGPRVEDVAERVRHAARLAGRTVNVVAGTDREALLPGADVVATAVSIGGGAYWGEPYASEVGIPQRYGVSQSVADTIGPGGVFRFLRTAPTHLQFCLDMERLCPNALMLNYTNPMAMLTWLHSTGSSIRNVGLCHSVQGTTKQLAKRIDVPYDEVQYLVAGINHQAWVLRFFRGKEDLYPKLREAAETHKGFVEDDTVRTEMMKQFGYFVTESTRHNSEYLPYFRRTQQLAEHYGLPWEREVRDSRPERPSDAPLEGPPPRSHEYAVSIIEALVSGQPYVFYGNVMNHGLIDNLPNGCCVEVPCVVEGGDVRPCHVGALPTQCAALNRTNVNVQELAVEAALKLDKEAAFHAVALDPLTAAVLPLPEIRSMFEEMWAAEGERLAHFGKEAVGV